MVPTTNTTTTTTNGSRNVGHRYQPGNPGGPGRPKKAQELAILDNIKADWPPERVTEALNEAMQMARDTRSWRGILSVLELVLSYGIGRPTQTIVTSNGNLEMLLAALADDEPATPADVQRLAKAKGG